MREASGEYGRCLEEKRLLVDEEVLIVDCGSLNLKGIQWKGGYIDGRGWGYGRGNVDGYSALVMDRDWRPLQHGRIK